MLLVWPHWSFLFFFTASLDPGLLNHWANWDPYPASPQLLLPFPRYMDPFNPLPHNPSCPIFTIRDWFQRWMIQQNNPQMGWFMAPSLHLGRGETSRGPAWRALGTTAVSDLTAPTPSPLWCQVPNGHSRMVAISHAGSQGSFLKSRNTEWRNNETHTFFPLPFSSWHWSSLQQFIISATAAVIGMERDTFLLSSNGWCDHYKYSNISGNYTKPFLGFIDSTSTQSATFLLMGLWVPMTNHPVLTEYNHYKSYALRLGSPVGNIN